MKCKNTIKLAVIVGITSSLMGCASFTGAESRENIAKLKYGMSEAEVLSLLGTPDSVSQESKLVDRWVYEFKQSEHRGRNMFVRFHDNALIKTGELSGREVASEDNSTRYNGSCTKIVSKEMREEALCVR